MGSFFFQEAVSTQTLLPLNLTQKPKTQLRGEVVHHLVSVAQITTVTQLTLTYVNVIVVVVVK